MTTVTQPLTRTVKLVNVPIAVPFYFTPSAIVACYRLSTESQRKLVDGLKKTCGGGDATRHYYVTENGTLSWAFAHSEVYLKQ